MKSTRYKSTQLIKSNKKPNHEDHVKESEIVSLKLCGPAGPGSSKLGYKIKQG